MRRIAIVTGFLWAVSTLCASAQTTKLVLPASGAKITLATSEVAGVHFAAQITHTTGQGDLCEMLEVLDRDDKVVSSLTRGETRVVVAARGLAVKCKDPKRGTVDVVFFPPFK
jgi:hypothetical protein